MMSRAVETDPGRYIVAVIDKALVVACLTAGALVGSSAYAGTLEDIKTNGAIRIAYREDAQPFSYRKDNTGDPKGFIVDLCRAVAVNLGKQLGVAELKTTFVSVTSADRFDAITSNKADLLCEATTQTLKRRETLSFSIPTFVDGASFIIGANGPKEFKGLAGKKVGVLVNTTTEADLKRTLQEMQVKAEVVTFKSHQEGIQAVQKGAIAAYYGDRGILTFLLIEGGAKQGVLMADTYLSVEPYALAMRRGDDDFRLAVDRALSEIYRSGVVSKFFTAAFGPTAKPSQILMGLYMTSALPQ